MRSAAATVPTYVSQVRAEWTTVARALADLCSQELASLDESMRYGMPTYSRDGVAEFAWAAQRRYPSVYVMRSDVLQRHRATLAGLDVAKGCVRFQRPERADLGPVRAFAVDTAAARGPVC